jgi:mannitol 2-dehydrogenase
MVDCIVPATGPEEHAQAKAFTVEDAAPVSHENFRQWVIEDRFCQGRPDWDKAGALFSDDVERYEAQKIRILNAGHQVIANPGELLSIETISGCMEHPQIGAFFHKVVLEEIVPHVEAVPAMQPTAYVNLVTKRLSNSAIRDTTRRVAFDGSSRHTGFVLPSLRDGLAKGCPISGLELVEANWARMCEGTREDGSIIEANDPFWSDLTKVAKAARDHPRAWLEQRQFYGNLVDEPRFAGAFEGWLQMIWADGVSASLNKYLYGQH